LFICTENIYVFVKKLVLIFQREINLILNKADFTVSSFLSALTVFWNSIHRQNKACEFRKLTNSDIGV